MPSPASDTGSSTGGVATHGPNWSRGDDRRAEADQPIRPRPRGDARRPMSGKLPEVYLARHGETAWTLTGQHTGRTDIPLTERGERNASALAGRLAGKTFDRVFASPLRRASRTAELAGFGDVVEADA